MKDRLNMFSSLSRKSLAGLTLFSLLFVSPTTRADEAAVELLNRMNQALHQLNYKGTLAYLRENSLSSLRIEHTVVNGVEVERVVRLNEAGNEISRELQGFSLASIPKIGPEMNDVYSFDMGRVNRVANIPCRIITARPKDRKRYLQKYCIDSTTGMLLDYMLVGKSHKPVEQFMFTTVKISLPQKNNQGEGLGLARKAMANNVISQSVTPVNGLADNTVVTPNQAMPVQAKPGFQAITDANLDDGWVMEALPAGFEISQAPSMKEKSDQSSDTKHYIVSDGLSSLSVFVSPLSGNREIGAVKINAGALNVVTQQKGNSVITAVGEVPESTLRNIVDNLRKK